MHIKFSVQTIWQRTYNNKFKSSGHKTPFYDCVLETQNTIYTPLYLFNNVKNVYNGNAEMKI